MFQRRELPFVFMNGAASAGGQFALENRSLIQFSSNSRFCVGELYSGDEARG